MQLVKKIFLGILIASLLFAGAYLFLNFYNTGVYNTGIDALQIYENYKNYVIFLYVSIISIYIFATIHSRISTTVIVGLLLMHFLRGTAFFTQNILGISSIEFWALAILFLLALAITHIKYRIRYPLILLVGIPFIIILLNHVLSLYPDKPNFEGFYSTQETILSIQTTDNEQMLKESEAKIKIITDNNEQIINSFPASTTLNLQASQTQIIFSSKTGLQNTYAYITFPRGDMLTLYPQSAISIPQAVSINQRNEINETPPRINIIQGKLNIHGGFVFTGNTGGVIDGQTEMIPQLIQDYTLRRNTYFINQIGGQIMLNPTIDAFIGRYINFANSSMKTLQNLLSYSSYTTSILIPSFDQNKLNYDEFHAYLDYTARTKYTATEGSSERIMRDTKKGRNSTNIKARRDIITSSIKSVLGK